MTAAMVVAFAAGALAGHIFTTSRTVEEVSPDRFRELYSLPSGSSNHVSFIGPTPEAPRRRVWLAQWQRAAWTSWRFYVSDLDDLSPEVKARVLAGAEPFPRPKTELSLQGLEPPNATDAP